MMQERPYAPLPKNLVQTFNVERRRGTVKQFTEDTFYCEKEPERVIINLKPEDYIEWGGALKKKELEEMNKKKELEAKKEKERQVEEEKLINELQSSVVTTEKDNKRKKSSKSKKVKKETSGKKKTESKVVDSVTTIPTPVGNLTNQESMVATDSNTTTNLNKKKYTAEEQKIIDTIFEKERPITKVEALEICSNEELLRKLFDVEYYKITKKDEDRYYRIDITFDYNGSYVEITYKNFMRIYFYDLQIFTPINSMTNKVVDTTEVTTESSKEVTKEVTTEVNKRVFTLEEQTTIDTLFEKERYITKDQAYEICSNEKLLRQIFDVEYYYRRESDDHINIVFGYDGYIFEIIYNHDRLVTFFDLRRYTNEEWEEECNPKVNDESTVELKPKKYVTYTDREIFDNPSLDNDRYERMVKTEHGMVYYDKEGTDTMSKKAWDKEFKDKLYAVY